METVSSKLLPIAKKIVTIIDGAKINLTGDRDVEWSWVAAHMPTGPGRALDFGCGLSYLALIAARKGFNTTAVDLQAIQVPFSHPNYRFIQ